MKNRKSQRNGKIEEKRRKDRNGKTSSKEISKVPFLKQSEGKNGMGLPFLVSIIIILAAFRFYIYFQAGKEGKGSSESITDEISLPLRISRNEDFTANPMFQKYVDKYSITTSSEGKIKNIDNSDNYAHQDNNVHDSFNTPTSNSKEMVLRWNNISCSRQYELDYLTAMKSSPDPASSKFCYPHGKSCGRVIIDNFITTNEVNRLIEIAEVLMQNKKTSGGPVIADINTGFVFDSDGLENIYQKENNYLQNDDYILYHQVTEKLQYRIMEEFQITNLHLTSPTFITRIIGNPSWKAKQVHDEYWHPHVDKNNTHHYDYSGLLYLSDYGIDFAVQKENENTNRNSVDPQSRTESMEKGSKVDDKTHQNKENKTDGIFSFYKQQDPSSIEMIVEPKKGRALLFTAGDENLHSVNKLVSFGARYVLSFWFTCNPARAYISRSSKSMTMHENNPNKLKFTSSEYASKKL